LVGDGGDRAQRATVIRLLRRRRWSLAWLIGIVLVGIGLAVLASIPILRGAGDGRIGSLVGEPAPAIDAEDLEGRRWTLEAADGRLVWVNYWATWCPPCRTEMPAMQTLAEAHRDDLLILGIDWGEDRAVVEDFVARYAVDYPILLDPRLDNFYRWAGDAGLPRHYFIGTDGRIVREVLGPIQPADMVAILDDLLPPS
jgi:thiol-disulfide isomerase/thioredoxin